MKKSALLALATSIALLNAASLAQAAERTGTHWGYGAENGPTKWASMHPKFRLCGTGKQQSPINIPTRTAKKSAALAISYKAGSGNVVNNGHTVQVNVPIGNYLTAGGRRYRLLQFHFHTPSENHVGGKSFPMEMHLVHKSTDGKLAVVSVMIEAGGDGKSLIDRLPLPKKAGDKQELGKLAVDPASILPKRRVHFAFGGSLTTPPCSEGVAWFVMATPVKVATATIKRFHAILGNNNRNLNPLNGRSVHLLH